jgi:hypothetical protein
VRSTESRDAPLFYRDFKMFEPVEHIAKGGRPHIGAAIVAADRADRDSHRYLDRIGRASMSLDGNSVFQLRETN